MKNHLKTTFLFLFLPILVFAQNAFEQAQVMVNYEHTLYEENLTEVLAQHLAAGNITSSEKVEVETIVTFAKTPFQVQLDYPNFSLQSLVKFNGFLVANDRRKAQVREQDYDLAQACDATLPSTYEDFRVQPIAYFSEEELACYKKKYLEKYPSFSFPTFESATVDKIISAQTRRVYDPVGVSFPTKLVDASSQFLVTRVKEELLLAFFDDFLEEIRRSKELTTLLPNTYFLLENNDIFKVPSMGAAWVTAFEEDLEQLPEHLEYLVLTANEYEELRDTPAIQMFLLASSIYDDINKGGELDVWRLIEDYYQQFPASDFYLVQLLELADLIQENLLVTGYSNTWYSEAEVDALVARSKDAALYFLGLIYQQNRALFQKLKVTLQGEQVSLLELLEGDAAEFVRDMSGLLRAGSSLNTSFQRLQNYEQIRPERPELYQAAALDLAYAFFDFLDESVALVYFKEPTAYLNSDYIRIYKPLAFETLQTLDAALARDYGKLLVHSTQLLQPIIERRIEKLDRQLVSLDTEKQKQVRKQIKHLNGFIKNYIHYGGFMVDVLSAQSAEEVHFIIDKYAAPVQSYRVNRSTDFSMNFGAYPGLYTGYELASEELGIGSFVTGVTAPLGLSFSWGKQKMGFQKPRSSVSLFFPLVDIGAAFSYRWQNDAVGFPDNLTWRQVLSPGAHLVWGLGDTPLALTAGAQYTPELRKVDVTGFEFQSNAWRIGASLTVDIPIFYLKR